MLSVPVLFSMFDILLRYYSGRPSPITYFNTLSIGQPLIQEAALAVLVAQNIAATDFSECKYLPGFLHLAFSPES